MTQSVELSALVANNPMGFLAALGVAQICASQLGDPQVLVGWPEGPSLGAVLSTSAAPNRKELAIALSSIAASLTAPNLVPGIANFPPNSEKTADTDPIRLFSFELGREAALQAIAEPSCEPWVTSILALDEPIRSEKRRGSLSVTPFAARGPGTVMLARTMAKLGERAAQPAAMEEALEFWVREDSIAGYLDARAKRNAAHRASRKDLDNYGVPAAGWLALASLPLFPAASTNADVAVAPGWRRVGKRSHFRWPTWSAPIGVDAIRILLSSRVVAHLNMKDLGSDPVGTRLSDSQLRSLGITSVWESERLVEGNNDGALSTPIRLWPRRNSEG